MKKQYLILFTSALFILLFVNQDIGLNVSIFGLVLTGLLVYLNMEKINTQTHKIIVVASVFSCLAFAWYGDFVSFVALALSILFLQFRLQSPQLKLILSLPIIVINAFATSVRFFQFSKWLPAPVNNSHLVKKAIAYFGIPIVFIALFFSIYSVGSDHFSSLIADYSLEFNPYQLAFVILFGTYFSFSFWNYWVPDFCIALNPKLNDALLIENQKNDANSIFLLDSDSMRRSGVITFLLLNLLLIVFIGTFNYEQFFESIATSKLSAATHERVNAVLFSIFLSIVVVLLYFKGQLVFDSKASNMKLLAKIWIVLNGVLIVSTLIINSEYIAFYGLTYKRLGVNAFLFLAAMSLFFTFKKITKQKSNAYLFNQMIWCCYGVILFCSVVNWGNLITIYNISVNKGVEPVFLSELNFNDSLRRQFLLDNKLNGEYAEKLREEEISIQQKNSFLSKTLYYEFLK